jgi:hypothetical protein
VTQRRIVVALAMRSLALCAALTTETTVEEIVKHIRFASLSQLDHLSPISRVIIRPLFAHFPKGF